MTALLQAVYRVPDYLLWLFEGNYRLYAIGVAVVFLIVLLFSNKVITVIRDLFVMATVVFGVICYFKRIYPMFWICAGALVILAVFRLLLFIITSIVSSRRRRRIERTALEKAERRRGSWSEKRGYSGEKPADRDVTEKIRETEANIRKDSSSKASETKITAPKAAEAKAANAASSSADAAVSEGTASSAVDDGDITLSREQAISAAHKLRDLKDLGILTEEEFDQIKARLYSRLG
ncbi:MAG: SHOCT domain-containing protein [Lachnospiraceae bacterium]|nr:SHOCT domain-containing protein [Lachnospiraceae bacterium]